MRPSTTNLLLRAAALACVLGGATAQGAAPPVSRAGDAAGPWSRPERLARNVPGSFASVTVGPRGDLFVGWGSITARARRVHLLARQSDGLEQSAAFASANEGWPPFVQLVAFPDGAALASWRD